jgi:hypothetical protein
VAIEMSVLDVLDYLACAARFRPVTE